MDFLSSTQDLTNSGNDLFGIKPYKFIGFGMKKFESGEYGIDFILETPMKMKETKTFDKVGGSFKTDKVCIFVKAVSGINFNTQEEAGIKKVNKFLQRIQEHCKALDLNYTSIVEEYKQIISKGSMNPDEKLESYLMLFAKHFTSSKVPVMYKITARAKAKQEGDKGPKYSYSFAASPKEPCVVSLAQYDKSSVKPFKFDPTNNWDLDMSKWNNGSVSADKDPDVDVADIKDIFAVASVESKVDDLPFS